MKENRSSLLLLVSLLLFLMSFIILCTWGYNTYFTKREGKKSVVVVKDTAGIANATREIARATRDSLQKIYAATISQLGNRIDSSLQHADSIRVPLGAQMAEFYKLQEEIVNILKDNSNIKDLGLARDKITELQRRITVITGKYNEVEADNKRLYAMISQLSGANKSTTTNIKPVVMESSPAPVKGVGGENTFIAYDLRLSALSISDEREMETQQAFQTDKFVGSFIVKNNNALNNVAEMIIVIVQPDGRVMQKSAWESGTFETHEGKKIYSCKMRFDYTKGEPKKLLFSVNADKYQKGNYSMQVYYKGNMIGRIYKTLT